MKCVEENLVINPEDLPTPAKIGFLKSMLIKYIVKNKSYLCEENKTNLYDMYCNLKSESAILNKNIKITNLKKEIKFFCSDDFQDLALQFCAINEDENDLEMLEKFMEKNFEDFLNVAIELTEADEGIIENELNCASKG